MRELLTAVRSEFANKRKLVMATLVFAEGSTYRRPGARLVITEDGQFFGLVSGGCLEGDLMLQAKKVFMDSKTRIVEYDMRAEEEGAWGLALGCNGRVLIHLQLLLGESQTLLLDAQKNADESNQEVIILTCIDEGLIGAPPMALLAEGQLRSIGGQIELSQELHGIDGPRIVKEDDKSYFVESFQPQFHVLILGAGPDVGPVCDFARQLEWKVTVADHRVAYLSKARSLKADYLAKVDPEKLADSVDLEQIDAVVLMSHNLDADKAYLNSIAPSSIPYVGLLGPKSRASIIIDSLGFWDNASLMKRIHSPVGLDLGGEGPEAIALSIISEIQADQAGRSARPLRGKDGGIHE